MHVAVGIIFNEQGQILIAQRLSNQYCGGLWEFPGGKVERNETVFAALQRELYEEVGITILHAEPWHQVKHTYPDREVLLDCWTVKKFTGIPFGVLGQEICWVPLRQLNEFTFPKGNQAILLRLNQSLKTWGLDSFL